MTRRKSSKLVVTEKNRAPLYHQLFLILLGQIHDGTYGVGNYLPGEKEVASDYGVSRITANRALNELAALGLVVREKGRGTRVRAAPDGKVVRGPADFLLGGSRVDGFDEIKVLAFDYRPAPAGVAAALGVPKGAETQYAVRAIHIDGRPYNHLTTHVPADIGRRWSREDMNVSTVTLLLRRHGVDVDHIDEVVTATLADVPLARILDVTVGAPLLKVVRTVFDGKSRAVEHVVAFYPPDRFEYRASLDRRQVRYDRGAS